MSIRVLGYLDSHLVFKYNFYGIWIPSYNKKNKQGKIKLFAFFLTAEIVAYVLLHSDSCLPLAIIATIPYLKGIMKCHCGANYPRVIVPRQ